MFPEKVALITCALVTSEIVSGIFGQAGEGGEKCGTPAPSPHSVNWAVKGSVVTGTGVPSTPGAETFIPPSRTPAESVRVPETETPGFSVRVTLLMRPALQPV